MKTVLIILGILAALLLIGLVWPLLIAGGIAYFLFSDGSIGWGIATCLIGIFVEIAYIAGVITESGDGSYHDSDSGAGGGGISWPMAFTALYIIDKERKKDS